MDKCYELRDITCTIDCADVLRAMRCPADSSAGKTVLREYEKLYPKAYSMLEPVGIIGMDTLPALAETEEYCAGTPVIYMCTSIGGKLASESRKAFQEGNYLEGLLWDTMADCALFSMEKEVVEHLRRFCAEHGVGIRAQLSAPDDIPMSIQRVIWERLELEKRFGIRISSGYMFDPVKTVGSVFILTDDMRVFQAAHNCRKCQNIACLFRRVPDLQVTICQGERSSTVSVKDQESLLDALRRQDYRIHAACGGKGRCNKCGVQILKGAVPVTGPDKHAFSQEKLLAGWRLACQVYPVDELEIYVPTEDTASFEVLSEYSGKEAASEITDREYLIAIDIGTTTVAMELLGADSEKSLCSAALINSQRAYGADVISRIEASAAGKRIQMQDCIQEDLKAGVSELLSKGCVTPEKLKHIAVSGNTTMIHLLMGYDCSKLGIFPFQTVTTGFIDGSGKELIGFGSAETTILPGISAFVGGDIVAGLYACGFHESEDLCLLIDLGTNGEMALGNRNKILVTSTAAGPAFEGGNITWGMGSINGAICSAEYLEGTLRVGTIGEKPPVGICGTGIVELTAALTEAGYLSETGKLIEEYFSAGVPLAETPGGETIVLTQKDIRELQLAKAAIRAGVETLLLKYGVEESAVSQVYLAGGFGYRLNTEKAIAIGMLPQAFRGRIQAVGNSSLAGAAKYLLEDAGRKCVQHIVAVSTEIDLGAEKEFNEFYMDAMYLEES